MSFFHPFFKKKENMKVDAFELKNKSSSGMNPPSIKKNTCNISHVDKKIAVASRVRDKSVKSIQNVSKFLVQEKYHQRASRMEELLEILRRNIVSYSFSQSLKKLVNIYLS